MDYRQTNRPVQNRQQNTETEEERQKRLERLRQRQLIEKKHRQDMIMAGIFVLICVIAVIVMSAIMKKNAGSDADSEEESVSRKEETSGESISDETESQTSESSSSTETEETASSSETPAASSEPTEPASEKEPADPSAVVIPSWITQDLLTVSEYNRPGIAMPQPVHNIVVHYVANPGSTAKGNRDYFEDLSRTLERKASAHFVVGLSGEIIQCIPITEMAYANAPRNEDTISVEVCHPYEDGKFSDTTYWTLVRLLAWLLEEYGMDSEDLIRHYDCNGKSCPLYYVEHPDAWQELKDTVGRFMTEHPDIANELP